MDLVSVAPVSPFKSPLFHFTNPDLPSVVAGFMPSIFYSVATNGSGGEIHSLQSSFSPSTRRSTTSGRATCSST